MRLIPRINTPWSTGVWALLIDSFASNFGFFLLMPVLAVYLTRDLGWSAWAAGLLLAVRQFAQQGLLCCVAVADIHLLHGGLHCRPRHHCSISCVSLFLLLSRASPETQRVG